VQSFLSTTADGNLDKTVFELNAYTMSAGGCGGYTRGSGSDKWVKNCIAYEAEHPDQPL